MQGNLSEFRLAEILQLVAVQQKTGLLRLTRGQQLVTFYFDHGLLVSSRDRRHAAYDPLLEYLTRVGYLQPEMATFLRSKMENSREDVAELLLGERFLTEDELLVALEDLAQEQIYQTFSWREGTYQFIGGEEALAGLRYKVSLKIESVLMEGARRADEWPRLREKLPGPEVVVDLARDPDTQESDRVYRVLSQIQGLMRIGELLQRARLPEFDVYEILAAAVENGTVRIVEKPTIVPPIEPTELRPARPAGPARPAMLSLPRPLGWSLALGVSVLSALAAWQIAPRFANPSAHETARALDAEQAREMLRTNLEVYRALHGRYPASLTDLENASLASPLLLQRAAPLRYTLSPDGRSFQLAGSADIPTSTSAVH